MIAIVGSIEALTADTEVWFVDIWGVLHNGARPFAAAVKACQQFRARGGIVVLVSNAPRPAAAVAAGLDKVGVPRDAYDAIQSSGDTARTLIGAEAGQPIYHLGPERDLALYDGLDVTRVSADAARVAVCTGLVDDEAETPQTYAPLLQYFAGRGVPMICANPDLTVERDGRIIPCAGAIAALYGELGGTVSFAGKPYPPIYHSACGIAAELAGHTVERAKILAIGDGVRTDIAGAAAMGLRSVYVASPVHLGAEALNQESLARLFPDPAVRPSAAMVGLSW